MNLNKFVGNMVVNGICNALAEIVGVIVSGLMLKVVNKRKSLALMFGIACVGLFLEGWFEDMPAMAMGAMYFAKSGSAGGDNLIYVFTGEMFPTAIKNVALSFGMLSTSIGATIAPSIGLLSYFPMFCVLSLAAFVDSITAFFLPVQQVAEHLDTVEQLVIQS